jgi:hypothetical protein
LALALSQTTGDTSISTNEEVLKPLERIVRSVVDNSKEDLGELQVQ